MFVRPYALSKCVKQHIMVKLKRHSAMGKESIYHGYLVRQHALMLWTMIELMSWINCCGKIKQETKFT